MTDDDLFRTPSDSTITITAPDPSPTARALEDSFLRDSVSTIEIPGPNGRVLSIETMCSDFWREDEEAAITAELIALSYSESGNGAID